MFITDQDDARRQITADHIERLADDYTRANFQRNQRSWRLPLDAAHELAKRARRWAIRTQLET